MSPPEVDPVLATSGSGVVADVCIVGGGLAGSAAAVVLGRAGHRVLLIDPRTRFSRCFKAEKIEPDQAAILQDLGLLTVVQAAARRIEEEVFARGGVRTGGRQLEQYGVHYHDLVNAVRCEAAAVAELVVGRVSSIDTTAGLQRVKLADGRSVHARLVVLASGSAGDRLHEQLGFSRRMVSEHHSMCYGFSISLASGEEFPFQTLTCAPHRLDQPIAFVTAFLQPDGMRVNFFAYQSPTDPDVRRYLGDVRGTLEERMPGVIDVLGDFRVTSRIEACSVDLAVTEGVDRDGIVLIGDAFQTVCPATGTGLSKVLTDVRVLCRECIPAWLATPGMPASKIREFYAKPEKRAVDTRSLEFAISMRRTALDRSLRFRIFRTRIRAKRILARWRTGRWSRARLASPRVPGAPGAPGTAAP